jgi:hypothetical protein
VSDEKPQIDAGTIEAFKQQWALYREHTARVDQIARQLAFAGIALAWIFHMETPEGVALPVLLVIAAFFLALALLADLLQEIASAVVADRTSDYLVHYTRYVGWRLSGFRLLIRGNPSRVLFLLKVGLILAGYAAVVTYLGRALQVS